MEGPVAPAAAQTHAVPSGEEPPGEEPGAPDKARRSKSTLAYLTLVAVPVVATVVLLRHGGSNGAGRPAAGHPAYDPFVGLLIAVPVILAACHLAGTAMRRLSQPAVIVEIIAGI